MKVLDGSHDESKLACIESWVSARQASMSKEGDSLDCEYWRRLREGVARSNRLS